MQHANGVNNYGQIESPRDKPQTLINEALWAKKIAAFSREKKICDKLSSYNFCCQESHSDIEELSGLGSHVMSELNWLHRFFLPVK